MVPRSLRYPMQTLLRLHGVNFGKRQLGRRRMFEKGLTLHLGAWIAQGQPVALEWIRL
jgi:hypothetical protein